MRCGKIRWLAIRTSVDRIEWLHRSILRRNQSLAGTAAKDPVHWCVFRFLLELVVCRLDVRVEVLQKTWWGILARKLRSCYVQIYVRWGHPLIGFARCLAGSGFWISHFVIVAGVVTVLLLTWFDATIHQTAATIATMAFGVACLFAFAGWIARCSR